MYPGKNFRSISPERLLDEIGILIKEYGVREVFDDSGTFPKGEWLETFCKGMIERGYNKKIYGLQHEDKCFKSGGILPDGKGGIPFRAVWSRIS